MDTITHTLFGLALYGAVDKKQMDRKYKAAYLLTMVGASQIPDIDVISQLWDTEGLYQMWHRGLTHSVFLTPVWALLFYLLCLLIFKINDVKLFLLAWLAVFIHVTSDLFNAWGTGYIEPFSNIRLSFGTIPIVDFVIWVIIGIAFIFSKRNKLKAPHYFKLAWVFITLHFVIQSAQGYWIYNQYDKNYKQVALSASFVPWSYTVITKNEDTVTLFQDGLFREKKEVYVLHSNESADLNTLFTQVPKAKTLYEWSPFVVLVDDDNRLGLYDPRFYRNGQSFLFEYMEKKSEK
ncbi:metal-dependent hydrolase [Lederbergia wuyishanensis]|uniref:Inner membrane protein n=1 Tax=Lederbergia wuyishanensis TaxID=1347903 RepID=A0ABU0D6X3_9BACI|nr:metal-dependent hydrolase [Lederbergia wuyishanensis]MCJ8008839.1 metal-dependent hydrolase [Lederbergia wuyishanensis]MDQ0344161.1 inner membrane protein [Lederbergia wuyishanensis]